MPHVSNLPRRAPQASPTLLLARFLATWALGGALLGVVFGPRTGVLVGLGVAIVYWALAGRARSAARSDLRRMRIATFPHPD